MCMSFPDAEEENSGEEQEDCLLGPESGGVRVSSADLETIPAPRAAGRVLRKALTALVVRLEAGLPAVRL